MAGEFRGSGTVRRWLVDMVSTVLGVFAGLGLAHLLGWA